MHCITVNTLPGFEEWRNAARTCLQAEIPPDRIVWQDATAVPSLSLFAGLPLPEAALSSAPVPVVPAAFMDWAKSAACHRSPERFSLMYRVLWRLCHENRNLLHYETDDDVMALSGLIRSVRRDAYKIKAFVRFREVKMDEMSCYVCWYEPEHYTLERSLPFFQTRFANMRWAILTPYRAAHWNGEILTLNNNPDPSLYPEEDQVEQYWLQYYASIFNPARVKTKAMLAQMPKKYWRNLPESVLIDDLLRQADNRVQFMLTQSDVYRMQSADAGQAALE